MITDLDSVKMVFAPQTPQERENHLKQSITVALKAWGLQTDSNRLPDPEAWDSAVGQMARLIRMIERGDAM